MLWDIFRWYEISNHEDKLDSLSHFFYRECDENVINIISIDLSHFNTSLVRKIDYMFHGCESIEEIDFTNFNTSSVDDMGGLFYGCSSLKSLNLKNFDTKNVVNMSSMFFNYLWIYQILKHQL